MHPSWGRVRTCKPRGHPGRQSRRGSTLIEVLVAFTAFLIVMLAFRKVVVGSQAAPRHAHEASLAKEAGRAIIEPISTPSG